MATRDVIAFDRKARETRTVLSDTTLGGKLKRNCHNAESAYRCRVPDASARDGGPAGARVAVGERVPRCGRALRMGLTHAQAVRGTRALRVHQPELCGRVSPRFPSLVSALTRRNETRGSGALTLSSLPPRLASRRDCVRLRRFPSTTTSRVSSVTFGALAADAPGESSRRGPGRADGGGAALEDGRDDDAAFRERAGERRRTPSLRVALAGRAAADDDDLVTCAHAVMENGGGHDRENDVAPGASPAPTGDARLEASLKSLRPSSRAVARHPWTRRPSTAARQTARHGEWLRDAQVVSAVRVEAPRWRLEDARGNRVVMHDARSFGETSDAARKNDWSLVVAHDRFDAAGGGAMHASGDGGGGGGSVSGRILANLLDANLGLHVLGVRTRERILAPGTRLTAVGEAVLERAPGDPSSSNSKSSAAPKSDDDALQVDRESSYRVRFRKPSRDFTSHTSHTRGAIDAFTVTNKSFDAFAGGFGRAGNALRVLSAACFVMGFGLSLSRVVRARVVAGREKKFRQRLAEAQAARAENGGPTRL